jgi:RNA polymerase sigma-70 factor (ECF subfamily)
MNAAEAEIRFRQVYRDFERPVLVYFLRRADSEMALDAAADTFLVAWRRIDEVPEGEAALRWLYGVARKVLANHRRSRDRSRALLRKIFGSGHSSEPTPESIVIRSHEDQELLAAVSRLRPKDQELLRLAAWEECSHAEIAGVFGCSEHAARERLYRITKQLRRDLRAPKIKPSPRKAPHTIQRGDER